MSQDLQWDELVSDWNEQVTEVHVDLSALANKLFWQKARLAALIMADFAIVVAVIAAFGYALLHQYSALVLSWLGFGIIFSVVAAFLTTKARMELWAASPPTSLKAWLSHEINRAKAGVTIARLTRIGSLIFLLVFHLWLGLGFLSDTNMFANITGWLVYYAFGLVWTLGFWWYGKRLGRLSDEKIVRLNGELAMIE